MASFLGTPTTQLAGPKENTTASLDGLPGSTCAVVAHSDAGNSEAGDRGKAESVSGPPARDFGVCTCTSLPVRANSLDLAFPELLDDVSTANDLASTITPEAIVRWAAAQRATVVLSTSMGAGSAVMLHLVSQLAPATPVVWVDSGYNTPQTYRYAEVLETRLELDLRIYTPQMSSARREALFGPIPLLDQEAEHRLFTQQVKLEPFDRALKELRPKIWLTGIRAEETDYRRGLNVFTRDSRVDLKVAPIFHWTELDVQRYLKLHNLPDNAHYFDPTKVEAGRECGLHTAA
ncbi:MAG: phosphoadenosine phosphosulfate reductase family protein [Pseudomonadota bacterium]